MRSSGESKASLEKGRNVAAPYPQSEEGLLHMKIESP